MLYYLKMHSLQYICCVPIVFQSNVFLLPFVFLFLVVAQQLQTEQFRSNHGIHDFVLLSLMCGMLQHRRGGFSAFHIILPFPSEA